VTLLGQRLLARDFHRHVAELRVRFAIRSGFTELSTPIIEIAGKSFQKKENPPLNPVSRQSRHLHNFNHLKAASGRRVMTAMIQRQTGRI
jgi:hypothetical protein